jgi:hypothetical protein
VTGSDVLDLALRLWPQVRDSRSVDDPTDLDALLAAQGQPGAPGHDCGERHTFACFPHAESPEFTLATGEPASAAEARFVAHTLVTRTLLGAGLHVDPRVVSAMGAAYALSWTAVGGDYRQTPLALANTLWLVALDPLSASDRPIAIDWDAQCYEDASRWDLDYRLFSHYDIRERAVDWAAYVSGDPARRQGVSRWTIIEPLLAMEPDGRVDFALSQLSEAVDADQAPAPAAAMLERSRVDALLQAYLSSRTAGGPADA